MERKILLFAKLMSLFFAGRGVFCFLDLYLEPKAEFHYVLAHENETGYRSVSKYGAVHFRENYLHCLPFRSHVPYRLRNTSEIDTLLLYAPLEMRMAEAKAVWDERNLLAKSTEEHSNTEMPQTIKVPVDLQTYYDLEDGDSMRLFLSPWRLKIIGFTQYNWERWKNVGSKEVLKMGDVRFPDLVQWTLTTKIFVLIVWALSLLSLFVKPFHIAVGMFVFNCVISALLYWVY